MLAKNANDNARLLNERGAWEFFASKLAPTEASPLPHLIIPTLRVGMQPRTLRVPNRNAERHKRHSTQSVGTIF